MYRNADSMTGLFANGIASLLPKDHRLTVSLLVAGTGALALFIEYYYRDSIKYGKRQPPSAKISGKIDSGNEKLEEAIRYYESALVDMQRDGEDDSHRMQVRAMLLRAYEIQAILSPDEFQLRPSVMIAGVPSSSTIAGAIMNEIMPDVESSVTLKRELPSSSGEVSVVETDGPRVRSDSLSSAGFSDFYEAVDILEEEAVEERHLPALYKDQLFLHKVQAFTCRRNRFQQFNLPSPTDYLVKVQCLRMAFDRLMRNPERASWMREMGLNNTVKLLDLAGADTNAFIEAYEDMLQYVQDTSNLQSIRDELKVRRVAAINVYDIVIDFCLLDSFDDLDKPPSSVTSVIGNSWISQGLRKTMLSTAVWGMISSKSKKASPDGFLSRFYGIMAVLTPSLAWGFLGDDPLLQPLCSFIRSDTLEALSKIFDETETDYSNVENLTEDLYKLLTVSSGQLASKLESASSTI